MKFKKITSILAIALAIVATSTTFGQGVYAAEKPSIPIEQQTQSIQDSIKLIESKYLIHNDDGTSSILPEAKKVIPSKNLKQITEGMKEVNSYIKNNILTVKKSSNGEFKIIPAKTDNDGMRLDSVDASHLSNFNYFWWGFTADLDSTGAKELSNNLYDNTYEAGAAAVISGAAGFGVGAVVCTAAATSCHHLYTETNNALLETPDGVTVYCYGSPDSGTLYKVEQLYS